MNLFFIFAIICIVPIIWAMKEEDKDQELAPGATYSGHVRQGDYGELAKRLKTLSQRQTEESASQSNLPSNQLVFQPISEEHLKAKKGNSINEAFVTISGSFGNVNEAPGSSTGSGSAPFFLLHKPKKEELKKKIVQ